MNSELTTWLEYSKLQLASEAFLDRINPEYPLAQALIDGNKHSSKFTPTEAAAFAERYEVIAHQPNTGTGFSGTLFKDKAGNFTLSFRSTEFVEDVLADSVGTNEGIAEYGWAFGQIADMEDWWAGIKNLVPANKTVTVTGYSLGGHLATAFAQLRAEAGELSRINHIYTFNGAGTGGILPGHRLTEVMALFRTVRDTGAMPESMNNLFDIVLLRSEAQKRLDDIRKEKTDITGFVSGLNDGRLQLAPELGDFDNYNLHLAMAVAGEWTTGALNESMTWDTVTSSLYDPDSAPTGGMMFHGLMTELLGSGISVVATGGLRHTYDRTQVKIEDQPLVRGTPYRGSPINGVRLSNQYALNDFGDTHSLILIIDSLAVMDVLARLDQNPARIDNDFATALIEAASSRVQNTVPGNQGEAEGDPLEKLVDALHLLFVGSDSGLRNNPLILQGGHWADEPLRNAFYAALNAITSSTLYQESAGLLNIVSLPGMNAVSVATLATQDTADGLAYRYAFEQLNPFALIGDAGLYAQHNTDGHLDSDQFSPLYLQDRAAMLSWLLKAQTDDTAFNANYLWSNGNHADTWYFQDVAIGKIVQVNSQNWFDPDPDVNNIVFGSSGAEPLTGGDFIDHLYGNAGNDTLNGGAGTDHLEGGAGFDTYQFSPGDGFDTVFDSDGAGVIKFGSIAATGSDGLNPDQWLQLGANAWSDIHNGITYTLSEASGQTRVLIRNGDNSILVEGWSSGDLSLVLSQGSPEASNIYVGSTAADLIMNWDMAGLGFDEHLNTYTLPGVLVQYQGLGGADFIQTDLANDLVNAGDGNDYVLATRGGADLLLGGVGNDYIHVGDPDPRNDGGASSKEIVPANNQTYVDGGDGDDTITVARNYLPMAMALDSAYGNTVYTLGQVAISYSSAWAANYVGWSRTGNNFPVLPDVPDFTFTGIVRHGVGLFGNAQGALNLYALFQLPQSLLDDKLLKTGLGATQFTPLFAYYPEHDNDDNSNHSLFGGKGNDMLEGGFGNDFIDGGDDDDTMDGERGDDLLFGGEGHDLILGGEGNDFLDGSEGEDALIGEEGNDTLQGGDNNDALYGDSKFVTTYANGDDRLDGGAGNDWLFGGGGNDILEGGTGNDWLDGGTGADVMAGGAGDDTYVVDDANDLVTEAAGEGNDSIRFTANIEIQPASSVLRVASAVLQDVSAAPTVITLPDNIEQLSLYGTAAVDGIGNDSDNGLWGNLGANSLQGAGGNDYLFGDAGDDVYRFNRGDGQDSIDNRDLLSDADAPEQPAAFDILRFGEGIADTDVLGFQVGMDLALTLKRTSEQVAFIDYFAADEVDGHRVYDHKIDQVVFANGVAWNQAMIQTVVDRAANNHAPTVNAFLPVLQASAGASFSFIVPENTITDPDPWDSITYRVAMPDGTPLPAWLSFDAAKRTFSGIPEVANVGNLQFYLWGTDNYGASTGQVVTVQVKSPNHAPVLSSALLDQTALQGSVFSYAMAADAFTDPDAGDSLSYNATLADGSALPSWLSFNAATRTFTGTPGSLGTTSVLVTAKDAGNLRASDVFDIVVKVPNLMLIGTAGSDYLVGGVGDDTLIGEAGNDTLEGGYGNDTYLFDLGNGVDTINEWFANSYTDILKFGAEINPSDISVMRNGVNLELRHANGADKIIVANWFAQNYDNYLLDRVDFADGTHWTQAQLFGWVLTVTGTAGDDTLNGTIFPDVLNGLAGEDTLDGMGGADSMSGGTGNDTYIVDNAGDTLLENVNAGADTVLSSVTFTLGSHFENLTLTGTSAINGTGNKLNNTLTGNSARNVLVGGAGNDVLSGNSNTTEVIPMLENLVIHARGTPVQGVYPVMQVLVGGVKVAEFTVNAASYMAYTIDPAQLSGTTDKIDIVFANDAYRPDLGEDRNLFVQKIEFNGQSIKSSDYSVFYDIGNGAAAFDGINLRLGQENVSSNGALRFSIGDHDSLDGGTGADQMSGGIGRDTYFVDNSGDKISEVLGEGLDTVRSSISYTLGSNLENLVLTGTGAGDGTGNAENNLLVGNAGANTLRGGVGSDTLIGNRGNDHLEGGAGNDYMRGGLGNDLYLFNRGDGMDMVLDNDSTLGNLDNARFGADISHEQIWFKRGGNNLEARVIGTGDKTVIQNWYLGSTYHVERFESGNGRVLLDSQIDALVAAMASFSPPTAGQTTLPANYQDALAPVIAANWQ